MPHTAHRLSIEKIEQASEKIDAVFLNSPQFVCEPLSDALGTRTVLKIETLNPIRSFKGRGADFFVSHLAADECIICASAGNFGQAMAYACRKRGISLTVFASVNANPLKIERMKALGAEVILRGEDFDAAKIEAKRFARSSGGRMIEDGLEPLISEGAGSMGVELLKFPEQIDVLLVPLGNGAMLGGVARIFKAHSPQTKIIAVQAAEAPAMIDSWRTGKLVVHEKINTIADGIGVRVPIAEAVEDMQGLVDDAILVREDSLLEAMRLVHRHAGVVAEPSGAVGIAAMLENPFCQQLVGTIICGGNLTEKQMEEWLFN